jgi:hypothetical protein
MYTFDNYLTLSRDTKSLATRYWCASLKMYLGESSAYGMKRKLFADDEQRQSSSGWLNNSSRFFNKKEQGEPVIRVNVVDEIDRRLNTELSFKALLCHPLWQLIDNPQPTAQSIKQVLGNLPANYVNLLFKEDANGELVRKKKISRKAVDKLCDSIDIHALTCWIAFCLETPKPSNPVLDINQLSAIIYLLKIGLVTPFSMIVEPFYHHLNEQFWHIYINQTLLPDHFFRTCKTPDGNKRFLPMRLISGHTFEIESALSLYHELCGRAIQIKLIPDSIDGRTRFYNIICHTTIQQLINILYQADNHPTTLDELRHWIINIILGNISSTVRSSKQ